MPVVRILYYIRYRSLNESKISRIYENVFILNLVRIIDMCDAHDWNNVFDLKGRNIP